MTKHEINIRLNKKACKIKNFIIIRIKWKIKSGWLREYRGENV
jgi:hypothetical protein